MCPCIMDTLQYLAYQELPAGATIKSMGGVRQAFMALHERPATGRQSLHGFVFFDSQELYDAISGATLS